LKNEELAKELKVQNMSCEFRRVKSRRKRERERERERRPKKKTSSKDDDRDGDCHREPDLCHPEGGIIELFILNSRCILKKHGVSRIVTSSYVTS
jgi:hypothetical protein